MKDKGAQIIVVGRSEHLKDRYHRINEISSGNSLAFISTSIPKDPGVLSENIEYISASSSKQESTLGAIYRALGFF